MTYLLNFKPGLEDLLRRFHPERKRRIKESLKIIARHPLLGKPLQEELVGFFSYRIGNWRIIYSIDSLKKRVHIIALGPREIIYKELERDLLAQKSRR